jgi:hypothetical protein
MGRRYPARLTAPRPPCWLDRCCSLEVSLPLQGRPCGRPPAAAVLAPAATRRSPANRLTTGIPARRLDRTTLAM